jgi:hypothetical protein
MPRPILAIGIALLFVRAAGADPITLSGSGTLDFVPCGSCAQEAFGLTVAPGDPFTFSLSFDGVGADLFPENTHGGYRLGAGRASITLNKRTVFDGSTTLTGGVVKSGRVGIGPFDGPLDWVGFTGYPLREFGGFRPRAIDPRADSDWRTSDAWPTDPLAATLNSAPVILFELTSSRFDGSEMPFARGTPGDISEGPMPAPIPEPTYLLLLGTCRATVILPPSRH